VTGVQTCALPILDIKIEQTKAELQKELRQASTRTIMWVAGILIGQTAIIVTLIKLLG